MVHSAISTALTLLLGMAGLWVTALPASAAPVLSITPITWNVVGLDSNKPLVDGPDTFASGARVCNTGNAAATNVVSNYVWDTNNAYIGNSGLTTLTEPTLAAGACTDFYYNIAVTRSALAFGQTRRFHITATADGLGTVSTPTPREIYVESLISQNRNAIDSITGPSNVVVGNTYTYVLESSTSSSFEQWSSFLNFPNFAFQIVSVSATYTQPAGATNSTIYADACGFQQDPTLGNYRECVGPENFSGGAVGGTAVTTYQVKILSAGAFGINALIYDKSGGSYHYNSDWGNGGESVTATEEVDLSITKTESADPVIAGNNLTYTIDATNAGPSTARDVTISDPLPAGTTFVSASNGGTNNAGTVSWSIGDLAAGASVSRTLTVKVNANRTTPISNTATVSTTTTETAPANNSVTQGTTVNTSADLSLTKTDAADPVGRGSNVSYTLTASNAGPSDAQGVTITDTLPANVAFVSATPSQGSCSQAAGTVTCTIGTIAAAANATVALVATPNVDGNITNSASVSSTTSDPVAGNDTASQGTTITPQADVRVTKTDSVDPVTAGSNVTYTITATNDGPSTAQNVQVSDAIPAGTDFVSASGGATPSGGTVTWNVGNLTSGASSVQTLTVKVHASRTNPVSNTATVSATTADPSNANDSATQNTAVSTSADLSLTKTDDADPVDVGANVTYTLTVSNAGPSDATGVQVSDPLPVGVSFISATPSQGGACAFAAGTVSCPVGTVAAGATATVAVVVRADADGSLTNTATVTSSTSDPDNANDGASQGTTVSASADVRISKSDSVDPVTAGDDLTYTLATTNDGPSTAQNVQVTDVIPAGTSFVSASGGGVLAGGTVNWNLGSIASGAVVVRTLTVHVDPSWTAALSNTATVSTTTADPSNANDVDTETTDVTPVADLSIEKTNGAVSVTAGTSTTYTITVTNQGPSAVPAGVEVTDTLPAGVSGAESEGDCVLAGQTLTCTTGAGLAVGASVSYDVEAAIDPDYPAANLANTASITDSPSVDPDGGDDAATDTDTVDHVADLGVSIDDLADPIAIGDTITDTIAVTNAGPSDATGVVVAGPLPANTTYVSGDPACGVVLNVLTCSVGTLAAGASVDLDVVLGPTTDGVVTLQVGVASAATDPDNANDSASEPTTVEPSADVSVVKTASSDPVGVGEDLTYTLTVHDAGPSDADDVTVTDVLPGVLTYVSVDPSAGACGELGGTVTCDLGTLADGATETIDIVVRATTEGVVANQATVTSSTPDPDGGDNASIEGVTVDPVADLEVAKTDGRLAVVAGASTTYTITLTNHGPSDVPAGVEITDTVPAGAAATSADADCAISGNDVTCTTSAALAAGSSVDFDVDVAVDPDVAGLTLSNTAAIASSPVSDPANANDVATDVDLIAREADLGVDIVSDVPDPVVLGNDVTYTIDVDNTGPSEASNVAVDATLPPALTFSSADPGCSFAAGVVTCSLATIAAGGSRSFTVTLSPTAAGLATLPAAVSSAATDANAANDSDTEDTDVQAPPVVDADLSVAIDDTADPIAVGGSYGYTIVVDNAGPANAFGVEVEHVLPAGAVFVSAIPSQGSCSESGGTVTCPLGAIAVGGSVTIAVQVDAPNAAGAIDSTAQVSALSPDPAAGNDDDLETTDVVPLSADLSLVKSDAPTTTVTAGGWTTYTLTLSNAGPDAAPAGVVVTDTVPAGTSVTTTEADCVVAGGSVTCTTAAPLGVGGAVSYDVGVTVDPSYALATVSNTAQIQSSPVGDPDPTDDVSTDTDDVVTRADLSLAIDDTPDPVVLGNDVTYTLRVDNAGPSDAASVLVTSALPAELDLVSAPAGCSFALGLLACDAGTVAAAGNASFDVVVRPNVTGAVALDATVGSATNDPNAANDADTEGTTVLAPPPADVDLGVSLLDAPDPVAGNGVLTYTLGVSNGGPDDADGVELVQQLPPTVIFQSASAGCSEALGVVTCTVGPLNGSASASASVVVQAPASVQALSSTLSVTTTSNDANAANDSATAPTAMVAGPSPPAADLGIVVTDTPDPVDAGGSVTYSIGVNNAGPDTATDAVVTFVLPPGATFAGATPLQGTCSQAAGVVTCDLGDLNSGASTTISVDAVLTLEGTATATASVASAVADPAVGNNAAGTTTTVNPIADLAIANTDGITAVGAGTSTTYTITLSNAGPSTAAAGIVVVDRIPAGTTAHVTDPACSIAGSDVTCTTTAPLAASASVSWQVTLDVPVGYASATLDNTAAIRSSPTPDPAAANDSATDQDDVTAATADLSIFKEDEPDPVIAGGKIAYTITVTNDGPGDAADVVVTDPVPANTTVKEIQDGGTEAGGVVTWNLGSIAAGQSVSVHLVVEVDANHDGDVSNTATVASSTLDPDAADDSATAVTTDDPAGADLDLTKEVDEDSVAVGDVVTYTIAISNGGPADATGVVVKDALPNGLEYLSSKASRGSYDEDTGRWTVGDLAVGDHAKLEIRTRITSEAASSLKNVATVAGLDQADDTPANDQAEAEVEVLAAEIEIVDPIADGEVLAFTGWNLGLAFEITVLLLVVGTALTVLGRRLERSSRDGT